MMQLKHSDTSVSSERTLLSVANVTVVERSGATLRPLSSVQNVEKDRMTGASHCCTRDYCTVRCIMDMAIQTWQTLTELLAKDSQALRPRKSLRAMRRSLWMVLVTYSSTRVRNRMYYCCNQLAS